MNQERTDFSRRRFLAAGSALAATTLLAGETKAAADLTAGGLKSETALPPAALMVDQPVTTEAYQTLINKTIMASQNTLVIGTTALNIKDIPGHPVVDNDITDALNGAISQLNGIGGQVFIPAGIWTSSGGHDLKEGISIEGVGQNYDGSQGSEVKMNAKSSFDYVFRITGRQVKCAMKNFTVNMTDNATATGLLIQNALNNLVSGTYLENITFRAGAFGIKVDSTSGFFECILNDFSRVSFIGCRTGFYCNTINSGFSFKDCYFSVFYNGLSSPPMTDGFSEGWSALSIERVGNLSLEHCLFVGNQPNTNNAIPTDKSTILKTLHGFNNISFYDCQDENLQYTYQNANSYSLEVPLVFRNCLVQSKFKFTGAGTVIFDSCLLNVTGLTANNGGIALVQDTGGVVYPTGIVKLYLHGQNRIFSTPGFSVGKLSKFTNVLSRLINEAGDINPDIKTPPAGTYQVINASIGQVKVPNGASQVTIYNKLVTTESFVFAQAATNDSGGALVKAVSAQGEYFIIYLTQNAAAELLVNFQVKNELTL